MQRLLIRNGELGHHEATVSIAFESIAKHFGSVVAVNDFSCEVSGGELHAFVGENGAGKSTVMKILTGRLKPDSGKILLNGSPISFRSPDDALKAGIGMAYQHFTLVPSLSILDNVVLGDRRVPFFLPRKRLAEQVEVMANRHGFHFDLFTPVSQLRMAERQKVEILKLLWREARVLILDEPTSQLAPFEAEDILNTLAELARAGRTVLLVSHNLQEVLHFCPQITVIRRGRFIATVDSRRTKLSDLASLVVGELPSTPVSRTRNNSHLAPILSLRGVSVRATPTTRSLNDVSLDLHRGEMVGIAGVVGSGEEELGALLTGHLQPHKGALLLDGKEVQWKVLSQPDVRVAHVPADGRGEGSIASLSLTENLFLREAVRPNGGLKLILSRQAMSRQAAKWLSVLDVRPASPDLLCNALSGGNLQRLVLTREMLVPSDVLVAVNPTAGLNAAGAVEVRHVLRGLANGSEGQKSKAVVLISSDLSELLECDRVVVLHRGEIAGIEETRNLDAESLGLLMGGVKGDLVRALKVVGTSATGQCELRGALHQMLTSHDWWQRRLAAQIGFRLFDREDLNAIDSHHLSEEHPAVRAWLLLIRSRLAPERHLADLALAFDGATGQHAASPQVLELLGVQMHLLGSEDLPSLRKTLAERLGSELTPWEIVLGYHVLRSLGAEEAEEYHGLAQMRLKELNGHKLIASGSRT